MKADPRVAKRYARAVFRIAQRNGEVDAVETDLAGLSSLMEANAEFKRVFFSPRISRDDKIRLAENLFSDRVTALTMSFLRLILNKRRELEYDLIREEFVKLRRQEGQVIYAQITSATELTSEQQKAIVQRLADESSKKVEPDFRIDPAVLGGVKVAFGNYVLDGTVRGSLRRLSDQLRRDLLKQS